MKRKKYVPKQKSKKNTYLYFMGALIILIMVGGAINMDSDNNKDAYEYNGLKFAKVNVGWLAYEDNGNEVYVLNNPAELKNITLGNLDYSRLNLMEKIYVTYNPEEIIRTAISQFDTGISLSPRKVPACTKDVSQCANLPLRTCEDATETVGVVEFQKANKTEVTFNNNCLLIKGKDLTKIVDKLIVEQY